MQIRSEQLSQIGQSRSEDFENRLIAHLRKHHQDQLRQYPDEQVRNYVRKCQFRAESLYEIMTEQGIACYAQIPLVIGDDFEIDPAWKTIPAILGRRSFEQNTRAKMALAFAYQLKALKRKS